MREFSYALIGFFGFLLVTTFNISLGIILYSYVENFEKWQIALIILGLVILSAALCSVIDYIRRKIMIESPLKDILRATEQMARGDFDINLSVNHIYKYYDEFDYIKDDLRKMAGELSKSEILKNDFIANVSHEIKTPLSIIQSYAKLLENDNLPKEDKQKYLESMQNACKKLSNLVTNILRLNKLENQQLTPDISNFNLSELLASQIIQYEDLIEKKNIELECDIEEDLYINSGENYLGLIFNNLLSNAIKFTNDGGKIIIKLKKINENYEIVFKDSGCGMDKETGMHMFDKFYQGDTSHSNEGNGLGLALVKKVIDILGGTIKVESELNVGTTFVVVIKEQ